MLNHGTRVALESTMAHHVAETYPLKADCPPELVLGDIVAQYGGNDVEQVMATFSHALRKCGFDSFAARTERELIDHLADIARQGA